MRPKVFALRRLQYSSKARGLLVTNANWPSPVDAVRFLSERHLGRVQTSCHQYTGKGKNRQEPKVTLSIVNVSPDKGMLFSHVKFLFLSEPKHVLLILCRSSLLMAQGLRLPKISDILRNALLLAVEHFGQTTTGRLQGEGGKAGEEGEEGETLRIDDKKNRNMESSPANIPSIIPPTAER
jgi:hypothetical protein